jgi:hypothetical protein
LGFTTSSSLLSIFSRLWPKKANWKKIALFNKNKEQSSKVVMCCEEFLHTFPYEDMQLTKLIQGLNYYVGVF